MCRRLASAFPGHRLVLRRGEGRAAWLISRRLSPARGPRAPGTRKLGKVAGWLAGVSSRGAFISSCLRVLYSVLPPRVTGLHVPLPLPLPRHPCNNPLTKVAYAGWGNFWTIGDKAGESGVWRVEAATVSCESVLIRGENPGTHVEVGSPTRGVVRIRRSGWHRVAHYWSWLRRDQIFGCPMILLTFCPQDHSSLGQLVCWAGLGCCISATGLVVVP